MVNPNPTEQNYSIFYQLLAGLSPEERGEQLLVVVVVAATAVVVVKVVG